MPDSGHTDAQAEAREIVGLIVGAARSEYLGFSENRDDKLDEAAAKLAALLEGRHAG